MALSLRFHEAMRGAVSSDKRTRPAKYYAVQVSNGSDRSAPGQKEPIERNEPLQAKT